MQSLEPPAPGLWRIDTAVPDPPRLLFRRVFSLSFPRLALADEVVFRPEEVRLRGRFLPLDFDAAEPLATASGEPWSPGALQTEGDGVRVSLESPWPVAGLRLSGPAGAANPAPGLYRVDGESVSAEATARLVAEKTKARTPERRRIEGLSNEVLIFDERQRIFPGLRRLVPSRDFIGRDFLIRPLGLDQADGLELRGFPTGPRLGLADPGIAEAPPAPATYFWQASGEVGRGTPAEQGEVDAGAALAAALERFVTDRLDRLADDESAMLTVSLVVESDAPCRFRLDELVLSHRLVQKRFDSGRDKEVVRFPGDSELTRTLRVRVPAGAQVISARLTVSPSLEAEGPLQGGFLPGDPPSELPRTGSEGIRLTEERWAAQEILPTEPIQVTSVVLGVMALTRDVRLRAELHEDVDGAPSEAPLASGEAVLAAPGRPVSSRVRFGSPVLLPARRCWLVVKTGGGRAVWRTDRPGRATSALPLAVLLRPSRPGEVWSVEHRFPDVVAHHRLLVGAAGAAARPGFALRLGDELVEPERPAPEPRAEVEFDLAPALRRFLLSQDPTLDGLADIPLELTTAVAGQVTAYPPRIEYR